MIDAFYQSLVCFFIPYFVSLRLISTMSVTRCLPVDLTHLCLPFLLFSSFCPPCSFQAYADSDVDLFTWGTPITTLALFIILVHLGIETKTWVKKLRAPERAGFVFLYNSSCFYSQMSSALKAQQPVIKCLCMFQRGKQESILEALTNDADNSAVYSLACTKQR